MVEVVKVAYGVGVAGVRLARPEFVLDYRTTNKLRMMRNRDLIAYLKPVNSRLGRANRIELVDLTGQVTDVEANSYRLTVRLDLPGGIYRMYLRTKPRAFVMATANIEMVRVPDGRRVPVGPWDLDHVTNVMALPMAKVYVNGALKGGLWFAMPGPEEIAEERLFADLGFEAASGANELVLELMERDRERMGWDRLEFAEIREDDRRRAVLLPASGSKPRVFATQAELSECLRRWRGRPEFDALGVSLRRDPLVLLTDNSQGTLSLAMIYYAITGDVEVGERARDAVIELARAATWSGRPDPLLMGGENDRGISLRLFHVALAWEQLQPLLSEDHRKVLLAKAGEYLRKMYDFTVLQRAYMGYPAIDPHSLGSWNGVAIACMAFYDDLEVARHALPFFHGLFMDSLQLFPESGKAAWATYFPFHLVLYLAAASVFGGPLPETAESRFLDNLGAALLTCFESPNSQELQRGLRTREHRFLTAFLHRFHATPGIDSIYRTFAERERRTAGDLSLGVFDLLYAPDAEGATAVMPHRPLYAKDVGDVIASSQREPRVSISMSAGAKAGRRSSFTLMPQNREFAPSMGAIEVAVDGAPVLCNLNISSYGINSALTNTLCLEDGGGVTNGQYLNGAVRPDQNSSMRRYLCGERFMYAHVAIAHALQPALEVEAAERVWIFDRVSGAMVIADSFAAGHDLQFATHLHCSGSAKDVGSSVYRLSGGQADLIAGIKGGSKALGNEEKGELYVEVLGASAECRVVLEEPTWIPGYIYGLNYTGREEMSDGRFPRYTRWRLEMVERERAGEFLFALAPKPGMVSRKDQGILLPGAGMELGRGEHTALGVTCECECLLWEDGPARLTALGVTRLLHDGRSASFEPPADLEYGVTTGIGELFAASAPRVMLDGFEVGAWDAEGSDRAHGALHAAFRMTVNRRDGDSR